MDKAVRVQYIEISMKVTSEAINKLGDEINHCQQINEGGNYDGYLSNLIRLEQIEVDKYEKLKEELYNLACKLV